MANVDLSENGSFKKFISSFTSLEQIDSPSLSLMVMAEPETSVVYAISLIIFNLILT